MHRLISVVVAAAFVVGACAGEDAISNDVTATSPGAASTSTTATANTDATTAALSSIPAGTYSRVLVRDAVLADGAEPAVVDEFLGADGELPEVIKVEGDRWTYFMTSDQGETEIGTLGTASYNDDGHWVLVEEGNAAGFTMVFDWTLTDGTLTMGFAPVQIMEQDAISSLLFEGDWEQGP